MSNILWGIIACGALAILYAFFTSRVVLSADQGNARMQEIAAAVREGAQAYLNRQYRTIAIVGVVIFVLAWLLLGPLQAVGFLIGAVLVGPRWIHRHERVGARQRADGSGRDGVARAGVSTSPSRPVRSPACWSPVWRCSASPSTTPS